jgi:hypothetical protein
MSDEQIIYAPEDWLRDAAWVNAKSEDGLGGPDKWGLITAYFERTYGPTAEWRHARVIAALGYFARHTEEFDEGLLSISYSIRGVASATLLLALRKIYTEAPAQPDNHDWPVDEVKALARKIENIRD